MPLVAATFTLLAVLHSVLGEALLLGPLLEARLPRLRISRWLGARTLRFAWHLTSLAWLALTGAVVCGARTIGDAKLVGLFKRVRGTPFATWDDLLFTPLSFVLALCFGVLGS